MAAYIRYTLDDCDVLASLQRLPDALDDVSQPLGDISGILAADAEGAFHDEAGPAGDAWPRLKRLSSGSARSAAPGPDTSSRTRGGLPLHPCRTRPGLRLYAAIHQLGGEAGRGHSDTIPARPFLGVSEDGKQEVLDVLARYFGEAWK